MLILVCKIHIRNQQTGCKIIAPLPICRTLFLNMTELRVSAIPVFPHSHPFCRTPLAALDYRAATMEGLLIHLTIWLEAEEKDGIASAWLHKGSSSCALRNSWQSLLHSIQRAAQNLPIPRSLRDVLTCQLSMRQTN